MQVEQYDNALGAEVTRRVMAIRLITGLVQGALLYWLYQSGRDGVWPATAPYLFMPLFMLVLLLPVVLISSLGHMAPRKVLLWTLGAAAFLLVVSLHEAWRGIGLAEFNLGFMGRPTKYSPSMLLIVFSALFLYIAHALVMAAAIDERRIATYASYFEIAWKLAIQLLFSAFFVAVLWAVLWMGAGLFGLVKLNFLERLLEESWFVVPVICFAFSCALHITDVRPAIVRGIRTLLLVLSSWILPVAVVIIAGFLCTLPFTGLDGLWKTRHATPLLLTAVGVMVVLINAAFQNGHAAATLAIRISARTAAILVLPLTGIAIYALGLRVHDYGWTSDRIVAAACILAASCYAIGYQWAAQRYDTWLVLVAPVNVGTAFVALAVLLALFTPIADPARLSVNNQVGRLEKGLVKADKFDYDYLRFDGQRYGQAALVRLARQGVGTEPKLVSEKAAAALKRTARDPFEGNAATLAQIAANITVWPAGERLPEGFLSQRWIDEAGRQRKAPQSLCLIRAGQKCDAVLIDADGNGKQDVMLIDGGYSIGALYSQQPAGEWELVAHLSGTTCKPLLGEVLAGRYTLATPRFKALEVKGVQLQFEPVFNPRDCALP
jgi:hypothetical protein